MTHNDKDLIPEEMRTIRLNASPASQATTMTNAQAYAQARAHGGSLGWKSSVIPELMRKRFEKHHGYPPPHSSHS